MRACCVGWAREVGEGYRASLMLSSFLDVRRFVFGQTGSLRLALPCLCTCGTSSHSYKRDNSSVALHGCISEQQQQQQQQRRQLLRWTGHRSTAAHHTSPRHQHHVQGPLRVGPHQPTRCMCLQTLTVPGGACVRRVCVCVGWWLLLAGRLPCIEEKQTFSLVQTVQWPGYLRTDCTVTPLSRQAIPPHPLFFPIRCCRGRCAWGGAGTGGQGTPSSVDGSRAHRASREPPGVLRAEHSG